MRGARPRPSRSTSSTRPAPRDPKRTTSTSVSHQSAQTKPLSFSSRRQFIVRSQQLSHKINATSSIWTTGKKSNPSMSLHTPNYKQNVFLSSTGLPNWSQKMNFASNADELTDEDLESLSSALKTTPAKSSAIDSKEELLSNLRQESDARNISRCLELLKQVNPRLVDNEAYSIVIRTAFAVKQPAVARSLWSEMNSFGLYGDQALRRHLYNYYLTNNQPTEALDLLRQIHKQGSHPTPIMALSLFHSIETQLRKSLAYVEFAHQLYEFTKLSHSRTIDPVFLPALTSAFYAHSMIYEGREMLNLMRQSETPPEAYFYSSLLTIVGKTEHWSEIFYLYDTMKKDMIKLDTVTYTCLMSICRDHDQPKRGLQYYKEMKEAGVQPDAKCCMVLMDCFIRNGQPEQAFQVMSYMRTMSNSITPTHYSALISELGKKGYADLAWKAFKFLASNSATLDTKIYNTIMLVCANHNRATQGLEVSQMMVDAGVAPDAPTVLAMVKILIVNHQIDEALAFCEQNVAVLGASNRMMMAAITEIVKDLFKSRRVAEADKFIQGLRAQNVKFDAIFYTAWLSGLVNCNKADRAVQTWRQLSRTREIDGLGTATLINGLFKNGHVQEAVEISELARQMPASQISKDLFSIIITGLSSNGLFKEAAALFESLPAQGFKRSVATFNAFMSACLKSERYKEAVQLYQQLKSEGGLPDEATISTVIGAALAGGRSDVAWVLFQDLKLYPVRDETYQKLAKKMRQKGYDPHPEDYRRH